MTFNWYATAGSCPNPVNPKPGWYSGSTFLTSSYRNPATGLAYTPQELGAMLGGGDDPSTPTTTPTGGGGALPTPTTPAGVGTQGVWFEGQYLGDVGSDFANMSQAEQEALIKENFGTDVSGQMWGFGGTPVAPEDRPPRPDTTPGAPAVGDTVSGVPVLPPLKPSAEVTALAGQVGGAISGILEEGGLGIGEEVKEDLFLREAEMINASTAQSIKNLEDEMARRGLSNSGQLFSETMKLNAKSDILMANVMRDVEIADAYMKLASYENAIGMGVQFLSYLSEESWRQYQPTLYQWQAQVDMYKMAIQQSYAVGNMKLAHQQAMQLAQFEASTAIQMEEMKLESANAIAAAEGAGNIFTAILGWLIPGS